MGKLEEYLTVAQVADILKLSTTGVRKFIKCGDLQAVKLGASVRISEDALKSFLKQRRAKQ